MCVFAGCMVAGMSGVSRLSSSRSNSSWEDLSMWNEHYHDCYLETVRTENLARPKKVLITDVRDMSIIKRKLKRREFFENYENRLNNKIHLETEKGTNSSSPKSIPKLKNIGTKFNQYENTTEKSTLRKQLDQGMKTEVNEIQFEKSAYMHFAEKINLSNDSVTSENNIYDYSDMGKEDNITENKSYQIHNTKNMLGNITNFSGNEINNNKKQNFVFKTGISDFKCANTYINDNEFGDCSDEISNNNFVKHSKDYKTNNVTDANKSIKILEVADSFHSNIEIKTNTNSDITKYINKVEFFVCNNSFRQISETTEEKHSNEEFKMISENQINAESLSPKSNEMCNKNNNNNYGAEQVNYSQSSAESSLNNTLKGFPESDIGNINDTDFCHTDEKQYQQNSKNEAQNRNNDISTVNFNSRTNEEFNNYVSEVEFCPNSPEEHNVPKLKMHTEKYVQNFNDQIDKNKRKLTYDANEIVFCDINSIHDNSCENGDPVKDPLDISLSNGNNEVSNSASIPTGKNQTKNDSYIYNHSTPYTTDVMENNPLEASLKTFLENEKDIEDFEDNNSTIKYDTQSQDLNINSHNKFDNNDNQWLTIISDNTNFFDDDILSADKLPRRQRSCLDFTFSEIDKNSDFNSTCNTSTSFFSDDDLVMRRISRRDSIAEVVSSIDVNFKPTNKLIFDTLADTENSIKYNLDSQNMSLLYSITPPYDIANSSKDTTIAEDISEDNETNSEDVVLEGNEDIWINYSNTDAKENINLNKTVELSETSFVSNASCQMSVISNQGSDILELPSSTYLEVQKSSDELFHKNMSSSVNQLLAEIDDADIYAKAENFIDELIFDVNRLKLTRDISNYSKSELHDLIQEKVSSVKYARKTVKKLVGNRPYKDVDNSASSKVSNLSEESSMVESLEDGVYVIKELIYHVVDKDSLGKCDYKSKRIVTDKKVKESMNIELKGLKDDYDATDEQSLKCSTPKNSLSPNRNRNNSFSEEPNKTTFINDNANPDTVEEIATANSKSSQSSDMVGSSNSSPSVESQNFAEQEVTSESTDNDTKSDSSKEKQIDSGENVKKTQSISPNDQLNFLDYKDATVKNLREYCNLIQINSDKPSFFLIEYTNESSLKTDEARENGDNDSDESIQEYMEHFMNHEEEINNMWQISEAKYEQMYTARINDITVTDIQQELLNCGEKIEQLSQEAGSDLLNGFSVIEEQSTSFISNEDDSEETTATHLQYEKVDECCSCCGDLDKTFPIEKNSASQSLPPILEEPELENIELAKSEMESDNSFETLPPIFEEPELDSSCETKTVEFYSCHNSISMKSCDEIITSTHTAFTDECSECGGISSADVSTCNELYRSDSTVSENMNALCQNDNEADNLGDEPNASSMNNSADVSTCNELYRSDSAVSEHMNAPCQNDNDTENVGDESKASSMNKNDNEVVALEFMTYSYETNEFLKLEMACKNSSDDLDHVCCELP